MAPRSQVRLLKAFFEEAQEEFITVVADSAGLKRWLQSFLLVGTQEQNHEIMERLIQYRQSHPGPPVPCTNPLLELIQNVLNALPDSEIASIEASQLLKDMFLDTYLPSTTGFGQKVGMLNSLIRLRQSRLSTTATQPSTASGTSISLRFLGAYLAIAPDSAVIHLATSQQLKDEMMEQFVSDCSHEEKIQALNRLLQDRVRTEGECVLATTAILNPTPAAEAGPGMVAATYSGQDLQLQSLENLTLDDEQEEHANGT